MWIINRNATPVNCCVQYVTHSSGHTFHTFLYMQGFISKFVAPSPASQAAHWKVPKIPPSCPLFSCIFYHSGSPLATFTELKITNGKNKRIVNSAVMCRTCMRLLAETRLRMSQLQELNRAQTRYTKSLELTELTTVCWMSVEKPSAELFVHYFQQFWVKENQLPSLSVTLIWGYTIALNQWVTSEALQVLRVQNSESLIFFLRVKQNTCFYWNQ